MATFAENKVTEAQPFLIWMDKYNAMLDHMEFVLGNDDITLLIPNDTDDLAEGVNNLYYTDARVDGVIDPKIADFLTATEIGNITLTPAEIGNITLTPAEIDTQINTLATIYERVNVTFADSPFTATAGQTLAVDTSGGAVTITMPTLSASDSPITIFDLASTFDTNNCILDPDGQTFKDETGASVTDNFVLDVINASVTVYGGTDLVVR